MARPCARYNADGTPCGGTTNRTDSWCGQCGGFPAPSNTPLAPSPTYDANPEWERREHLPIDLDEAYKIGISRTARTTFSERHFCTWSEAEAQLRSMLEDLLQCGKISQHRTSGSWRLYRDGYTLKISPDLEVVTTYATMHAERTWAQTRSGVSSRISRASR